MQIFWLKINFSHILLDLTETSNTLTDFLSIYYPTFYLYSLHDLKHPPHTHTPHGTSISMQCSAASVSQISNRIARKLYILCFYYSLLLSPPEKIIQNMHSFDAASVGIYHSPCLLLYPPLLPLVVQTFHSFFPPCTIHAVLLWIGCVRRETEASRKKFP